MCNSIASLFYYRRLNVNDYHLLSSNETKILDEYFLKNLKNINTMLNIDINALNEHHFYNAIETMFPTWRSEQLYNNGNNISYRNYIQCLSNDKYLYEQTIST